MARSSDEAGLEDPDGDPRIHPAVPVEERSPGGTSRPCPAARARRPPAGERQSRGVDCRPSRIWQDGPARRVVEPGAQGRLPRAGRPRQRSGRPGHRHCHGPRPGGTARSWLGHGCSRRPIARSSRRSCRASCKPSGRTQARPSSCSTSCTCSRTAPRWTPSDSSCSACPHRSASRSPRASGRTCRSPACACRVTCSTSGPMTWRSMRPVSRCWGRASVSAPPRKSVRR